jgi:hypothetical protein
MAEGETWLFIGEGVVTAGLIATGAIVVRDRKLSNSAKDRFLTFLGVAIAAVALVLGSRENSDYKAR